MPHLPFAAARSLLAALSGTDNEDSEFLLRKDLLADHVRAAGIGKNVSQKEKNQEQP